MKNENEKLVNINFFFYTNIGKKKTNKQLYIYRIPGRLLNSFPSLPVKKSAVP